MSQDELDRELNGPNEPTQLQIDKARIDALEDALLKLIKRCWTCNGRGTISSWDVNNGPPLISCPDCALARATLNWCTA